MNSNRYEILQSGDINNLQYEDFTFFINVQDKEQRELFEFAKKKREILVMMFSLEVLLNYLTSV